MPIESPFHEQIDKRCTSKFYKSWAGYFAPISFDICHEPEYHAFRQSVGVIDVTPLFKYDVTGSDAGIFLDRIMVRDVSTLKVGRVSYLCWCDDEGMVIDDGTVTRISDKVFRVTAAEPSLAWFSQFTRGYDVAIEDVSQKIASLAVQGPLSRQLLKEIVDGNVDDLRFFGAIPTKIAGCEGWLTRTGYTGDLGYEIWIASEDANQVYAKIMEVGEKYRVMPCGIAALDVVRVEAGFIMNGVDYHSANHCIVDDRKASPYELGLDWCVKIDRSPFIGQEALRKIAREGPERTFVGLDIDWVETEKVFALYGLPPEIDMAAWRDGRPVYDQMGDWLGMATSGTWSPILKKNIAIAQIATPFAREGTQVKIEMTAEYRRHQVLATVVKTPFFNPTRKRS